MKKLLIAFTISIIMISAANAQTGNQNQQKQDTSTYALVGKMENFQLLYRALVNPGDVTPNQLKALSEWVTRIRIIQPDTSLKKPGNK